MTMVVMMVMASDSGGGNVSLVLWDVVHEKRKEKTKPEPVSCEESYEVAKIFLFFFREGHETKQMRSSEVIVPLSM